MMRRYYSAGGDTHVTKEGKTAKKGLWYNIAQKRKRGEKMRKKGAGRGSNRRLARPGWRGCPFDYTNNRRAVY